MRFKIAFSVFTSLTNALALVGIPRTRLFNDVFFNRHVDKFTALGNALTIHNINNGSLKRRCNFIFNHFDFGAIANNIGTVFDLLRTAHFHTHSGIKLQRPTARRNFRIAEYNTDFFPDLVDEQGNCFGFIDRPRQLS